MRPVNPEVIRSLTPIALILTGGLVGLGTLVILIIRPSVSDVAITGALGLAGSALTGAAGALVPGRASSFSVKGEGLEVESPQEGGDSK